MCKGSFIPEFKRCPSDLKMLQWHFSGSFVHTCQGKCDGRWEMGDGSCSCGFCLHRVHQHQPWPCWSPVHINHTVHALTVLIPEKARKEFCFVLTGLTSYSVNSNMIHGDQSENRNGTVIFLSCTSGGNQWDNNGNHTTELHEFISHQSLWKGFSRTCK